MSELDSPLPLTEHLEELRKRIIRAVICIIIMSCILYNFMDVLVPILVRPVGKLVFTSPQEAFVANIKLAFWGGFFFSSPFVLYEVWQFVSRGLKENERRYIRIFGPLSFILFILGAVFGYFVIIPIGIKFLLGFATDFVTPMITINNYISFIGGITLAFGVVFELPLVILFLTKMGIVTPEFLVEKRRHAIVLIFIAAAFLTPPDVITQCLMAFPLLALYEIGIIFSKISYKKPV